MHIVLYGDLIVFLSWLLISKMELVKRGTLFLSFQHIVIVNMFSPVLQ